MISSGYSATDIMRGIPYGMQSTAGVASGSPRLVAASSAARRSSQDVLYVPFSRIGVAGGAANFGSAPRPPRYGAHAPDRSGGTGGVAARCAASPVPSTVAKSATAASVKRRVTAPL